MNIYNNLLSISKDMAENWDEKINDTDEKMIKVVSDILSDKYNRNKNIYYIVFTIKDFENKINLMNNTLNNSLYKLSTIRFLIYNGNITVFDRKNITIKNPRVKSYAINPDLVSLLFYNSIDDNSFRSFLLKYSPDDLDKKQKQKQKQNILNKKFNKEKL